MFERDYMYLAYEVTDRMAADIYTKAFSDSRKWKHACVQIGLLEPEMLIDPEPSRWSHLLLTPRREPYRRPLVRSMAYPLFRTRRRRSCLPTFGGNDYPQRNTKGMIRSSWQRFRNSCGTSHHPRCNVLFAQGGCVPLGFCAVDHGRRLRIELNPRCNGSASTSTSSVRCGNFIRYSLLHRPPRLFSLDNISDGTILFNCSFRKSMARTSWKRLSTLYLHVFYGVSRL